jgi:hypothetical protein
MASIGNRPTEARENRRQKPEQTPEGDGQIRVGILVFNFRRSTSSYR